MLGSHEIHDVTAPHLFAMFCPFCRDVLAQGLKEKYEILIEKLEDLTGKKIMDGDLKSGIEIMNDVRRVMKDIYEFRNQQNPPITGIEAMCMVCFQFFTEPREWLPVSRTSCTSASSQGARCRRAGHQSNPVR
jgi:benzoyl-CoA reductase subunit C